jgi:hypothetical protein
MAKMTAALLAFQKENAHRCISLLLLLLSLVEVPPFLLMTTCYAFMVMLFVVFYC